MIQNPVLLGTVSRWAFSLDITGFWRFGATAVASREQRISGGAVVWEVLTADSESPGRYSSNCLASAEKYGVPLKGSQTIICGQCGVWYTPKTWHAGTKYEQRIWRCSAKYERHTRCSTPRLTAKQIQNAFTQIDPDEYGKQLNSLTAAYDQAFAHHKNLTDQANAIRARQAQYHYYKQQLEKLDAHTIEYTPLLYRTIINHATIHENNQIEFTYRDGQTISSPSCTRFVTC